jgi:hypothetical protein
MAKLNKNKLGLIFGIFFAIVHAVWALLVAIIPSSLQKSLDFIFNVHFIEPVWILKTFNLVDALLLVIVTFVIGYVLGWVLAWVWNKIMKK